jgi:hypothetical protein
LIDLVTRKTYSDNYCNESNHNVYGAVFFDGVRTYKESDVGKDRRDAEETWEKVETIKNTRSIFICRPLECVVNRSMRLERLLPDDF